MSGKGGHEYIGGHGEARHGYIGAIPPTLPSLICGKAQRTRIKHEPLFSNQMYYIYRYFLAIFCGQKAT